MEAIIKTIQQITQQYGKEILLEKRFLNIFNDLYPNRMDKETHALLSCMYEKGYLEQILHTKKRNIKKEIALISNSLVKDGHAQKDVQQLLRAIIVGIGVATKQEYSDILNGGTTHSSTDSKSSNVALTIIRYALLVLLMAVVIAMPYLYIRSLSILWPIFPITIIIAFCFIVYIIFYRKLSVKWSAFQNGCFNGLMFCLSTLLAIFPLWASKNSDCGLFYYWSPNYAENQTDAWFLTLICSSATGLFLLAMPLMAINDVLTDKKQNKAYKQKMVWGVVTTIICYFICISPILIKPYNHKKAEINTYNLKIQELKQKRQNVNKSLSFCGIQLGDSYKKCLSVIQTNMNDIDFMSRNDASLSLDFFDYDHLIVDNTDYVLIVDSIITATASWDNQNVHVYAYFAKGVNVAIKVTALDKNPLPMFISKYGRPEFFIPKLNYNETLTIKIEDNLFLFPKKDNPPSYINDKNDCRWTFKNSIISIKDFGNISPSILYINRNCEKIYAEHQRHAEKIKEEKRRQEEIRINREYQRQQRKAAIEKKRVEDNHKRALNEI